MMCRIWLWFVGAVLVAQFAFAEPESPAVKERAIAKELRSRVQSEQAIRMAVVQFCIANNLTAGEVGIETLDPKVAMEFKALTERLEQEDRQNRDWLKEVVAKHGWPGKSLVGGQGATDAWLLVQHADKDREFQQRCLDQMKKLPPGEVDPRDTAYLTDRILVGTGKKQIYGTQITYQDGKLIPSPIDKPDDVDERRKAIGLEPLDEYLKTVQEIYAPAKPESADKDK
jgi:hypothetical protein